MLNLDEIIIDGILYRRVEDKTEDRPINFNPFDISEKDEVFLFPNGIVTAGSTAWRYTEEGRKEELINKALIVKDKQVALSVEFRYNIMRKLLKYGYECNCLWNGAGKAYTIGYSINSSGVDFMPITWTNTSDICSIAFNSEDECNNAINTIVRPAYIAALKENNKLYKKDEWI